MKSILYDAGNNSFAVFCTGTAPRSTMTFSGCHRNLRAALTSAQGSGGNPAGKVAHVGPLCDTPAKGRHQDMVVFLRWASREGEAGQKRG